MSLPDQIELLKLFSAFLSEAGLSAVSIKNYLSDLRHFLSFCATLPAPYRARPYRDPNPSRPGPEEITVKDIFQNLPHYQNSYLQAQQASFTPANTVSRRQASIRRFANFLNVKFALVSPSCQRVTVPPSIPASHQAPRTKHPAPTTLSSAKLLDQFKTSLERERKSHSTVKNYLSDLHHFFLWTANQTPFTDQNLVNLLSESLLSTYVTYLKLSHTSTSVINRRQSSIKKLTKFCFEEGFLPENPFELKSVPQTLAPLAWLERFIQRKKKSSSPRNKIGQIYDRYHALPWTPYFNLALLILATTTMAILAYNQIISQARPSAAATSLTPPKRQLSFQGRLTDSGGTPITTAVSVVFKLFNASTGPTQLYTTGTCSITPDQDGIFNTLIGNTVCGAEITSTVFTDNRDVYLEITVGAETLTPRQQIATVGYALNSETLQGYPASASATINTVPVVDNSGNINIAVTSPSIISSAGTFTVQGQVLSLKTGTNSGGDVIFQPDALGSGQILALGGTTTEDSYRVTNANLTTGSLLSGYVGNDTATGRLLSLTSGSTETDRFWVAADGRAYLNTNATNSALIVNQSGTGDLLSASASGVAKFTVSNAGQCIEENSLINTSAGYKKIKDVLPGNQVLSLNEETGQFEYQTVEKTLDMGTKEIYELTTASGKKIETTANHPYLARTKLLEESNIGQQQSYQRQTKSNSHSSVNVQNVRPFNIFHNLNQDAINNETIAKTKSLVNIASFFVPVSLEKLGTINTAPNHPADKLINKSEITDDQTGLNNINNNIPQWTKVIYLKTGDEIATIDGFEAIASIRILEPKHVYDLQISNTHNFVANGIVAHNTYIAGSVGVGITTPAATALLDLTSTTKGFLAPRMTTTQRDAIVSPATGLFVYNTTTNQYNVYNGTSWGAVGGGGAWSDLTVPTANLSLAHAGYTTAFTFDSVTTADAFAFSSSSLTTGTVLDLSSTSTAGGASGASKLLDLTRSGTNANASHTAYGLYSAVTNTGTTSTNVGGYFSASGATNNYAAIFENGNVGIGTTSPTSKLHVSGAVTGKALAIFDETGDQSLLTASASGATKFTVTNSGDLNFSRALMPGGSAGTTGQLLTSAGTGAAPTWSSTIGAGAITPDSLDFTEFKDALTLDAATDIALGSLTLSTSGTGAVAFNNTGGLTSAGNLTFGGTQKIIGGTGTTSDLTLQTTSGVGATGADMHFLVGNNGATEAMTILNSGNVGIGTTGPGVSLHVFPSTSETSAKEILRLEHKGGGGDAYPYLTFRYGDGGTAVDGTEGLGEIRFLGSYDASNYVEGARITATADGSAFTSTNAPTNLRFFTTPSGSVTPQERVTIKSNGNVGIGTTSPGAKLEVVGQCIEENSLISTSLGEKKIKDIIAGDKVLSLNEDTGRFEYQTVEKTLDMGTKEIYELTTESGKKIETTGNHPYLVKTSSLSPTKQDQIAGDEDNHKSDDNQINVSLHNGSPSFLINIIKNNQDQTTDNGGKQISVGNIPFNHGFVSLANFNEIIKKNPDITSETTKVTTKSKIDSGRARSGEIAPAENQATAIFPAISEDLPNWPDDNLPIPSNNTINKLSGAAWIKVIYLQTGDEIATIDGFETISSIKILPGKHVYDLQISNTHNFVANGIVAHNTYITGAVTGKALAIFNETGDQNILTASQSGIPVFNLARVAGTAANGTTFTPSATGNAVTQAATGSDTNIAYSLDAKGSGALNLNGTATGDVNLAGGYGGTGCTVTNSNGNLSCNGTITGTFAGTLPWSSLIAPTANLSLAHAGYTTAFTFDSVTTADAFALSSSSLTTGTILDLSSTSTAGGASGLSKVLDIARSGTNANASHTAYGLYSAVTNTGTTSTNVGGYFSASGATNNYGLIVENGNVGIGTTGPTYGLDVQKSTAEIQFKSTTTTTKSWLNVTNTISTLRLGVEGNTSGGIISGTTATAGVLGMVSNHDLQLATNDSVKMTIKNDGKVGIGTTSPSGKLDIASGVTALIIGADNNVENTRTDLTQKTGRMGLYHYTNAEEPMALFITTNTAGTGSIAFGGGTSTMNAATQLLFYTAANTTTTTGTEAMRINSSGNVGIGTTSPTNILSLGNAADRKFWIENTASGTVGRALTVAAGGTVAGGTDITGGNLILQSGLGTGTGASTISFQTGTTLGTGTTLQTMSTKMTILGSGNVGIGTTGPNTKLQVAGTIYVSQYATPQLALNSAGDNFGQIFQPSSDVWSLGYGGTLTTNGTSVLSWNDAGNVGIGTTNPANRLHVVSSATSVAGLVVTGGSSVGLGTPNAYSGQILLGDNSGAQGRLSYENSAYGNLFIDNTYNSDAGNIYFRTKTGTTPVNAVTILGSGNVGIGTTGPSDKLHIKSGTNTADFIFKPAATPTVAVGGSTTASIITSSGTGASAFHFGFEIPANDTGDGFFITTDANYDGTVDTVALKINAAGNVGIGTTAPGFKLDVSGSIRGGGRARVETDRIIGATIGDTVAIGYFSNEGVGKNIVIRLKAHNSGTIDVTTFEIDENTYIGNSTNWLEIPLKSGIAYDGARDHTIDVYRQNIGSTADPLYVRVRNKNGGGSGNVQLVIEYDDDSTFTELTSASNIATTFNASTAPAGGAVSGIKGNVTWEFPVSNGNAWGVGTYGMYINNTGNVGIGTTGPGAKLDVSDGDIYMTDADITHGLTTLAATNAFARFRAKSGTGGGLAIYGLSDADATALEFDGIIGSTDPTDTTPAFLLTGSKSNGTTGNAALAAAETVLQVKNYATNLMTILGSGNVGIGTTAPGYRLDVRDSTALPAQFVGNTNAYIQVVGGSYTSYLQANGANFGKVGSLTNNDFQVVTNSTPVATFTTGGNVGIGTTSPSQKLDVWGNVKINGSVNPYLVLNDGTRNGYLQIGSGVLDLNANTAGMNINLTTNGANVIIPNGNVGIGTTGPTAKLHVVGNCVTGDTLLRIRRRKKRSRNKFGMTGGPDDDDMDSCLRGNDKEIGNDNIDDFDELLCPIRDIQPGDEVLSLNEATEALEYSKINKLMDMGIKEVYELTTKSGRTIRTTAAHPFLTLLDSGLPPFGRAQGKLARNDTEIATTNIKYI